MAFSLGKVMVTVGADTMRFQRGMRSAIGQMIFFSRSAGKMSGSMKKGAGAARILSVGFQALGHAATLGIIGLTAITAAVVSFSVKAIDKFTELDTALVEVAAISGATERQFKMLKKQTYELSEAVGQGADELAKGQKFLAMAGFEVQETLSALPEVAKIATIGMMELGDASDIVTNIMTGFGKTVDDLPNVVETLTNTMTSSNTNMRQLGDAMKYIGPLARAAGQDINETVAAIGMLGNAGLQGEMGGTALRNVMTRLLNPTGKAKKALEAMNIQVKNADGSIKSLADIMEQFEKTGLDASTAMKIFAQRAGPGFLALVNQGSDALRKLTQANKESSKAQEIYNKILESTDYKIRKAKVSVENYVRTIGDHLSKALVVGIEMIEEWEEAHVDAHTEVRFAVEDLLISILDFAMEAIKSWNKFNEVVEITTSVLAAVWDGLQTAMLAIIGAISSIGPAFAALIVQLNKANEAYLKFKRNTVGGVSVNEIREAEAATKNWEVSLKNLNKTQKKAFKEMEKSALSMADNMVGVEFRIEEHTRKSIEAYKDLLEVKLRLQKKQGEDAFSPVGDASSIDPYAGTGGQSMLPKDPYAGKDFSIDPMQSIPPKDLPTDPYAGKDFSIDPMQSVLPKDPYAGKDFSIDPMQSVLPKDPYAGKDFSADPYAGKDFSIDPYAGTGGQSMLPKETPVIEPMDPIDSGSGGSKYGGSKQVEFFYDLQAAIAQTNPVYEAYLKHRRRLADIEKSTNLNQQEKMMANLISEAELNRSLKKIQKAKYDESMRQSQERMRQWRNESDEYLKNMQKVIDSIARTRQLQNEQIQWQRDEAYGAGSMMSGQLTSGVFDEDLKSKNREAEMEYLRSVNDQKAIQNKLTQEHNDHIKSQIAAYKTLGSQISESAQAIDGLAQAYANAEPGLERQIAKQKMVIGIMYQVPGLADAVFGAMGMSAENAAISQAILNTALAATALGMGNIGSAIAFAGGAIGAIGSLLAKSSAKKTYQRPATTAANNNASADRKGDIVEALKEAGLFQPEFGTRTMNFFGNDPVAFQERDIVAERKTRKHIVNAERNRF